MPEGGMYPWKVQKIVTAPTPNYRNMTLPHDPPAGWEWSQNATTREWTLREKEVHAVALADEAVTDNTDPGHAVLDVATIPLAHAEPIGVVDVVVVEPHNDPSPQKKNLRHRHVVTESDTFQGICLRYKISATQLRQANCFSGTNLKLAPKILNIPHVVMARPMSREDKIVMMLRGPTTCGVSPQPPYSIKLSRKEAIAYLEMSDWNVETALDEMRADQEFELSQSQQKLG
jgi:LysM repeat protein